MCELHHVTLQFKENLKLTEHVKMEEQNIFEGMNM